MKNINNDSIFINTINLNEPTAVSILIKSLYNFFDKKFQDLIKYEDINFELEHNKHHIFLSRDIEHYFNIALDMVGVEFKQKDNILYSELVRLRDLSNSNIIYNKVFNKMIHIHIITKLNNSKRADKNYIKFNKISLKILKSLMNLFNETFNNRYGIIYGDDINIDSYIGIFTNTLISNGYKLNTSLALEYGMKGAKIKDLGEFISELKTLKLDVTELNTMLYNGYNFNKINLNILGETLPQLEVKLNDLINDIMLYKGELTNMFIRINEHIRIVENMKPNGENGECVNQYYLKNKESIDNDILVLKMIHNVVIINYLSDTFTHQEILKIQTNFMRLFGQINKV